MRGCDRVAEAANGVEARKIVLVRGIPQNDTGRNLNAVSVMEAGEEIGKVWTLRRVSHARIMRGCHGDFVELDWPRQTNVGQTRQCRSRSSRLLQQQTSAHSYLVLNYRPGVESCSPSDSRVVSPPSPPPPYSPHPCPTKGRDKLERLTRGRERSRMSRRCVPLRAPVQAASPYSGSCDRGYA